MLKMIFNRMDDRLVFDDGRIAPGMKRIYATVKGIQPRTQSKAAYIGVVAREGLYNLKNTGLGMTMETFKGFIGR